MLKHAPTDTFHLNDLDLYREYHWTNVLSATIQHLGQHLEKFFNHTFYTKEKWNTVSLANREQIYKAAYEFQLKQRCYSTGVSAHINRN